MKWKNSDIIKNPEAFKCLPDFRFVFIPRLLQNLFYCGVLKVKQYACVKKIIQPFFR